MLDEQTDERATGAKVFLISAYRAKRPKVQAFEVCVHLYIDVCSDGETRFGIVGADEENAICLLEPIFLLGSQLVRLVTEKH